MFGSFYAYRSDSWTTWAGYDYDGLNSKVLLMKYLSKEFNQNWTGIHKITLCITQAGGPKGPDGGCLNCRLIQMGSAISYGDNRCPQCGEQVS